MLALQRGILAAAAIVLIMALGPVAGAGIIAAPAHGTAAAASVQSFGAVAVPSTVATAAPNAASTMAAHALAATAAAGLNSRVISVPRPSATPAQVAQSHAAGYVTPLYSGAPAPLGVGYFGLSEGKGGSVVPTILNTTGVRGQVQMLGTGIQPMDLFASSPDSYGIQLNSVMTNVTLFGTPGYSFWTQNVVLYYAHTHFMILVTNIWNFSGGSISPNALYESHTVGSDDIGDYGSLGFYYSEYVVPVPVAAPFLLSLYMNSTIVGGRDAVTFTTAISTAGHPHPLFTAPYDSVVFNSTATGGHPLTVPSNYTANGYTYNPLGLTNDFELILGGPNGGSQADIATADATMGLAYWDATTGSYADTPAAFNYGGETGETVTGAAIAWTSGPGGPGGLTNYATVSGGPGILRGLWGAGGPVGGAAVTLNVHPTNAFEVYTPVNTSAGLRNFLSSESVAEPGAFGNTVWLTPGTYRLSIGLSDYTPYQATVVLTGATTISVTLTKNMAEGIYTPLWAFSNSQLSAISSRGSGTTSNPYVLFNNQRAPLSPVFGLYNDYVFPVYPGVFLYGTTASAEMIHGASITSATSTFQYPGGLLPTTNALQEWFWGVSNLALVQSSITGWFGSSAYYPVDWDTFNVIFYASSGNLIAGNDFATQGQALLMFSGGSLFGAVNLGGGSNTIWGNTFTEAAAPNSTVSVAPDWSGFDVGLGLELAEQTDLIYNNYFATPTTAWMLPLNLYSGDGFSYTETWNITPQAASAVHYAPGFPELPLTGSIAGTHWQGGNWWWDYGNTATTPNPYNGAVNPTGALPYDENATTVDSSSLTPYGGTLLLYIYGIFQPTFIYDGGDYAPL
jgi:thermopsin